MWQTKYASAVPKNLGLGLNFRPCSKGYFLSGRGWCYTSTPRSINFRVKNSSSYEGTKSTTALTSM